MNFGKSTTRPWLSTRETTDVEREDSNASDRIKHFDLSSVELSTLLFRAWKEEEEEKKSKNCENTQMMKPCIEIVRIAQSMYGK